MKLSTTAMLLLLGAGALAVYKYNKMSEDDKDALKEKGKKIFDDHISPMLKNALGMAEDPTLVSQKESAK